MPTPRNAIPTIRLTTGLPEDIMDRLNLYLFSDIEGRIPKSAYMDFFSARVREFFDHEKLDLAPYTNGEPGAFIVSGPRETIEQLKQLLQKGI